MNNDSKFMRVCFEGDSKPIDPLKPETDEYFGGQIGDHRVPLMFISDESKMGNRVCAACVVVDWSKYLEKFDSLEKELIEICPTYELKNIHFTDIVRLKKAHEKRSIFNEIGKVFRDVHLVAISLSATFSEFNENGIEGENEMYFNLHWNVIERFLNNVLNCSPQEAHLLIHMYREVDNNLTIKLGLDWINQYFSGHQSIFPKEPIFSSIPYGLLGMRWLFQRLLISRLTQIIESSTV